LAEKALRWHQHGPQEEIRKQVLERLGADTPTARPPVPLPDLPGIRFLGNVGEVVEEGRRMRHCIASYAASACAGDSYLFHIDHEGDACSLEVGRLGIVHQAQGPRNTKNKATAHGVRVLSCWANQFRSG
jgi:hypothetical protein